MQPFEKGRSCLLAAPLPVGSGLQAVLELFDKPGGFGEADRQLAGAAADFATELLRHALAERQTQRVLFDAVAAALETSDALSGSLGGPPAQVSDPAPPALLDRLREGLSGGAEEVDAAETVPLAEAIRALAVRHGPAALRHCSSARRKRPGAARRGHRRRESAVNEDADVFEEVFRLLTPERLLDDPAATGEGIRVCLLDSGVERSVLEQKFRGSGSGDSSDRGCCLHHGPSGAIALRWPSEHAARHDGR